MSKLSEWRVEPVTSMPPQASPAWSILKKQNRQTQVAQRYRLFLAFLLGLLLVLIVHEVAFAQNAGETIINNQVKFSQDFDAAVNALMGSIVETPIFTEAANIGAICLVVSIFPAVMSVVRLYHNDITIDRDSILHQGFVIVLIAILLGTPTDRGRLLGDSLVGFNGVLNQLTERVLIASSGENGVSSVAKAIVKASVEHSATEGLKECSKEPESKQRLECLKELKEDVIRELDPHTEAQWARRLSVELQGIINKAANYELDSGGENFLEKVGPLIFGPFGGAYGSGKYAVESLGRGAHAAGQAVIVGLCWALGQAFVVALEHVKILMVLVAPIFLGLQQAPLFQGFFSAWLKSYILLELGHLVYNLIISLVAVTTLTAGSTNSLVFPLVVAGLSIVFALVLITGGGINLYQAGSNAAKSVGSVVVTTTRR